MNSFFVGTISVTAVCLKFMILLEDIFATFDADLFLFESKHDFFNGIRVPSFCCSGRKLLVIELMRNCIRGGAICPKLVDKKQNIVFARACDDLAMKITEAIRWLSATPAFSAPAIHERQGRSLSKTKAPL